MPAAGMAGYTYSSSHPRESGDPGKSQCLPRGMTVTLTRPVIPAKAGIQESLNVPNPDSSLI